MRFIWSCLQFYSALVQRAAALCQYAWVLTLTILAAAWSPVAGIVIVACFIWRSQRLNRQSSATHGSAAWASAAELQRAGCFENQNGLPLGEAVGLSPPKPFYAFWVLVRFPLSRSREAVRLANACRGQQRAALPVSLPDSLAHLAIFGASGGGKTTCYAIPFLLRCRDNMVVLDVKGELAMLTARHRAKAFGHEIIILDPFGVSSGCGFKPAHFNPLDLWRGRPDRIADEARRMASAFVVETGAETDAFWVKISRTIITSVLTFLMAESVPGTSFNQMRDIISSPKLMDEMIEFMLSRDSCHGLLKRMAGQLQQCKGQTKSSAQTVCNSHIDFLDSLAIATMLADSTFDARRLITGRMTIYLCLPPDRVTEMAGLQRVLMSSLINLVFEAGENRNRRIRFLMDEAATLRQLDATYAALMYGRSYGLRMIFLFQGASQADLVFPGPRRDDFFSTVAAIYCATNDNRTAKEVSEGIGQATVHSRSD
ncbi:MAG: type IV secretory system conjugative DNA transfer family protein, partial [Planctomycetaceae bacterium]|nr:type IV secretory system conjugative DNA transfer family protein [Planctomycetaceae bacterium]